MGGNTDNSTCPSRGASDHFLGSGVPYALLHGVVEMSVRGVPHGTNAIYRRSRFLRCNLAKAENGLGKARARWQLTWLRSALLAPHLLGKSGEGLGKDANVLDVKVQSRAPLTLRLLGENPSTMLASHSVCDWISILCMHRGALPSDNNAEPSVSYHGVVMTYCEMSRAWGR